MKDDLNSGLAPSATIENFGVNDSVLGTAAQAFSVCEPVGVSATIAESVKATERMGKVNLLPYYKVIYSLHPVNSVKFLYCSMPSLLRWLFYSLSL